MTDFIDLQKLLTKYQKKLNQIKLFIATKTFLYKGIEFICVLWKNCLNKVIRIKVYLRICRKVYTSTFLLHFRLLIRKFRFNAAFENLKFFIFFFQSIDHKIAIDTHLSILILFYQHIYQKLM